MIGVIAQKVGMTQVFDATGRLIPVTVLKVDTNVVVGNRVPKKDGYSAVIIGSVEAKPSRLSKPVLGQFKNGLAPRKYVREFRLDDDSAAPKAVGDEVDLGLFENAVFVDIVGVTKGKGFQGVMKRHNFGGGRATHGSKFHRENGSTGMAAYPSRVIKGTKMAGRMGSDRSTVQNLRIVKIDAEKSVLMVKGAVPGANGGVVYVTPAKKKD